MKKYLFVLLILITNAAKLQVLAFPGAEGYGKYTTGGRFGQVYKVSNLSDNGPGSLRSVLNIKGKRIILFDVSGYIDLDSDLVLNENDVTILGQSAPGAGICIRNCRLVIAADNIIIRFLRFRLGDKMKVENDAICGIGRKNIIIDHCTFSWAIDENASFYSNENFTMQWCIISEALNNSYHSKGEHGYGGIWGGMKASFHHNLFAHNSSRNPRFNGGRGKYGTKFETELTDFRNNVIYNWGINSSYGGEDGKQSLVNNYYKSGPASKNKDRIVEVWDAKSLWYIEGNYVEGFSEISKDNWSGGVQGKDINLSEVRSNKALVDENIITQSAPDAYTYVLKYAGCIVPVRDNIDNRIINEVKTGKTYKGNGIINSQEDVKGYVALETGSPEKDTDNDGIPDGWESQNGLNPLDRTDANNKNTENYTFIEVYHNSLVDNNNYKY